MESLGAGNGTILCHPGPEAVSNRLTRVSCTAASLFHGHTAWLTAWLEEGYLSVESVASTLVLVAHPGDEMLGFSRSVQGRTSSASRTVAGRG